MTFEQFLYELDLDPVGVYNPDEVANLLFHAYNNGYLEGQEDAGNEVLL